jgi:hypothetical protein
MEAVYVRHRRIVPGKKVDRRNVVVKPPGVVPCPITRRRLLR